MNDRILLERRDRMTEVLNGAAAVVACSDYVAGIFRAEYPHITIRVLPHGIDLLRFAPLPKAELNSEIVFGYIGTLSEMKGVHVLVEAFARASPGRARLQLVGPSDDDFVKRLQEVSPGQTAITIHPAIVARDVPAMLGSFDLLCLPSQVPETYSLAVHEGFAAGLPALVSDLGYPALVVKQHECGSAVAPRDTDAWARAIAQVAEDPSLLVEWRQRIPLPTRVEEEGFNYSRIYRALQFQH
jgi:glycosyltransferase involved in cell wall biosynthesis